MVVRLFWGISLALIALYFILYQTYPRISDTLFWIVTPFFLIGLYDLYQKRYNVLRIYPVLGHLRYMLQFIRPEIQQYFIETNLDGRPFSREAREMVYARARGKFDALPFGTQRDVNAEGFDSIHHSLAPKKVDPCEARLHIGGKDCTKPYLASRLNISAMSYGALSPTAIQALNLGAKLGNFYHNTGEGGLSSHHLKHGGDIVWQIGTGYFGCRNKKEGSFNAKLFKEKSGNAAVKMIEIKLSQGAKPAHGGLLLAAKISKEIAEIRGIKMGEDCLSPPAHSTFSTPDGLLHFITELRELSGGKPVGFKLCIGSHSEFLGICKAMLKQKIYPDFITIDGAEGGTGAAPAEYTNFVGTPLNEGLSFVHNALTGCNLRDKIHLICSGKITSGFDMLCKMAIGADFCNSARGMMFALGCIQSRSCHNNQCPTGITTSDPKRYFAVDIQDKAARVNNFHNLTIERLLELIGATGLKHISDLDPSHIYRRVGATKTEHYDAFEALIAKGSLLSAKIPKHFQKDWKKAKADQFI